MTEAADMKDTDQPTEADLSPATRLGAAPDVVVAGALHGSDALVATARLLSAKIRTRELMEDPAFRQGDGLQGLVFAFRYGVVVTIGAKLEPPAALEALLEPYLVEPSSVMESEAANLVVRPGSEDRIGQNSQLFLSDGSTERLELVATMLSRSVILARDEMLVSEVFERAAPVIAELRETGRTRLPIRQVMRFVGNVLAARHRVMGAVQVDERPDLLWDHPELDRLYTRLEAEYELHERAEMLERKYGALGDFADALLNIVQDKRAYHLEAAIIALIALEVALNLFDRIVS